METEMLRTFFREVKRHLNGPMRKEQVLDSAECLKAVREFLECKVQWPFRPATCPVLGNYFFDDKLYNPPSVDYKSIGETTSRYDAIFKACSSRFDSLSQLREAEALLDGLVERIVFHLTMKRRVFCLGSAAT
jgi:hypothetical protein